jgi:putative nucleotidyltransferase with HDIG domain
MFEAVENSFRGLIQALQTAKLYGTEHAKFAQSLERAFSAFQEAFKERQELVFGIVGEELAFEKEVMFELSKSVKPMIVYLRSRGIEKMSFYSALGKEELFKFLQFLTAPKEEIKKEPEEYLAAMGIKNINVGKIRGGSSGTVDVAEAIDYFSLYSGSIDNFNRSLEDVLEARDLDYLDLRFNVSSVFENLISRHQELLKLAAVKRYDLTTFAHILNVSILSMFFASKLGLAKDDVLEIGTAALFHDIGKTYVSRKIIRKSDKLSHDEFETLKSHTLFGAEILLKYVDTLGMLPVLAAFEHHLKSGFRSYPRMRFPQKPHLGSAIISVCDIYDALSSRRSYKSALSPEVVYDLLMKEKAKLHYPELVDDFFQIMGVWPIGTLVVLNDSSIAVVREENEDDIFSPKVEVIAPPDKRQTLDLKENKPGLKIEKFLDPLNEGQPYVSLI